MFMLCKECIKSFWCPCFHSILWENFKKW